LFKFKVGFHFLREIWKSLTTEGNKKAVENPSRKQTKHKMKCK